MRTSSDVQNGSSTPSIRMPAQRCGQLRQAIGHRIAEQHADRRDQHADLEGGRGRSGHRRPRSRSACSARRSRLPSSPTKENQNSQPIGRNSSTNDEQRAPASTGQAAAGARAARRAPAPRVQQRVVAVVRPPGSCRVSGDQQGVARRAMPSVNGAADRRHPRAVQPAGSAAGRGSRGRAFEHDGRAARSRPGTCVAHDGRRSGWRRRRAAAVGAGCSFSGRSISSARDARRSAASASSEPAPR